MNKANECTCPSGDGSLRHPCPAHPAVEQAGGDERAVDGKPRATKCPDCGEGDLMPGDLCACGYETDPAAGYACSECDGSGDGYVGEVCRECDGSGWFVTPEQARAALAQPSPAQAEAEQPEIVAFRYRCTNAEGEPLPGWFYSDGAGTLGLREPLMAVSQHERIIGAMRAVVTQLRQHKNDYMDAGQETYRALQNEIREREAEIARLDGLVSGRTAERDAALAQPSPMRCLACGGYHGNSGLPCPNMRVTAQAQPSPTLPPFAEKVLAKLRRFNECAEDSDSGGVDIGRHWLDLLTQLGLLNRVQRSPALWEISQQGEDLLGLDVPEIEVPDSMIEKAWQRFERTLQQLETPGQAEQAEQAEAERPEGPTEDELEAAGLGYPLHKEEAVKLWYSGFRSEVITVLEAWEAIGHDIGMNPDKGELLDSLRYMLEKCEAHDAALAEVAGLRSLLNSLLCYVERDIDRMRSDRDKSDNKEIYDRSISLAMERLKAAQNAVFTTEPGCDTAVELAAQTTQAQHCVPVAREQLERLVRILDAHNYAKDAEALMALLAAAPAQAQHSVPEGWMLVPIEPTLEMLDARRDCEDGIDGYLVEDTEYYFPGRDAVRAFLARVYRGMLAAAPVQGDNDD